MITAKLLRDTFLYNAETGEFTYRVMRGNRPVGSRAGRVCKQGYVNIIIAKKPYLAHRLAWLYCYGELPNGPLDHKNLVKSDNRISNLRIATPTLNNANQAPKVGCLSAKKGVTWHARAAKWQAQIKISGRSHYLGLFATEEEASAAYQGAAKVLFGDFARAA